MIELSNNKRIKLKMRPFKTILTLWVLISSICLNGQNGSLLFDNTYLHEIHIDFYDAQYWDILKTNYEENAQFSGSDIPYLPATITIDGLELDSVGIRFKGKSAYYYVEDKKPFKIDINEFISGQNFDGLKKINLHNGVGDPGMQRNLLAYDLLRNVGVAAPRVSFCQLYINGELWGVYDIVEQVDKTFLKNNFADDTGNLFKNQRWSELEWFGNNPDTYRDTFELKTNKIEDDWSSFINLLDVINNASDEDFPSAIKEVFNVDQYLHVLAVDIMTNNWDSYIDNARNFYLYHEPESGLFHWIPWDYNLSMGGRINLTGNPYPPFDPDCIIRTDISYTRDNLEVFFTENTLPNAEGYLWDFGGGNTSDEKAPTHTFDTPGIYDVCLSVYRLSNDQVCEQKRCIKVDLTADPGQCETILNGSCPYSATDPIFQQVIETDDFCCADTWDAVCQLKYIEFQNNPAPTDISAGNDYDTDYNLLLNNSNKVLIHRLLSVPEFRDRYLDITCLIKEQHFNYTALFPKIEYFGDLLRGAIHNDPNYLFSHDYFEYDTGNGTGGGTEAKIPALKHFLIQRFPQIEEDITNLQHDCLDAFTSLEWHDVVINEFIASADENGYPDGNGEYDDWIELYNNTLDTVNLDHFYLSDDASRPLKWSFPEDAKIAPNDYLIVWADENISQTGIHTNFKLSQAGDEILLFHEDGTLIDQVTFDVQLTNLASARIPNGIGDFVNQEITPGVANELPSSTSNLSNDSAFRISPNPTRDMVNIELQLTNNIVDWSFKIYNVLGDVLFISQKNSELHKSINLKEFNLTQGMYFIEVNFNESKQLEKIFFIN